MFKEVDHESDSVASGHGAFISLGFFGEGWSGEIDVSPLGFVDEVLQEGGSPRGSSVAAAHIQVGEVSELAFHGFFIGIGDGNWAERFVRSARGIHQQVAEFVVIAVETGGAESQSDDTGTGESGHIDHVSGFELGGSIVEGVREDHATFGIGVHDLDGLAAESGDDIGRTVGIAADRVVGDGHDSDDFALDTELFEELEGSQDRSGSSHIQLHFVHVSGGFQADPSGIEDDPFSTDDDGVFIELVVVFQDQHVRWFHGPLVDGQYSAHAHAFELLFGEVGESEAVFLGGAGDLVHELFGAHLLGAAVDDVSGVVDDLSDGETFVDGGFEFFIPAISDELDLAETAVFETLEFLSGFVNGRVEVPHDQSFCESLQVFLDFFWDDDTDLFDLFLAECADDVRSGISRLVLVPVLALSETDEHDLLELGT